MLGSKRMITEKSGKKLLNAFRKITGTAAVTIADADATKLLLDDTGELIASEADSALTSLNNQKANQTDLTAEVNRATAAESALKLLAIEITADSSTSKTYTNSIVTAGHVPLNQFINHKGDISVTTANGSFTLACSAGIPAFTLILGVKKS